ncbi:histone deacetylase 6-like isoform X2, partial [Dinothrombium tinctorium]
MNQVFEEWDKDWMSKDANLLDGFLAETILRDNDYKGTKRTDIHFNKSTGVVYFDDFTEICQNFSKNSKSLISTLDRFVELGLIKRCLPIKPRKPSYEQISFAHSKSFFNQTVNFDSETTKTFEMRLFTFGCYLELISAIMSNEVRNGFVFAQQTKQNNHQEDTNITLNQCDFNIITLAASYAVEKLGAKRVLIVDWGRSQVNEETFCDSPNVLYFSISSHEFYEQSEFNNKVEIKENGFNINITLSTNVLTDSACLAIWHNLLLPIAYEFTPDLVIISLGFDAVIGCPKGEMKLSPAIFSHLCHSLMALANGKVAVVLEGGYCLWSLAESAAFTVKTLLGDPCPQLNGLQFPIHSLVVKSISDCISHLSNYWKCLKFNIKNIHPKCAKAKAENQAKTTEVAEEEIFSKRSDTCLALNLETGGHRNLIPHPEREERVQRIFQQLELDGFVDRCATIKKERYATDDEILLVHTKQLLDAAKLTETMPYEQMNPFKEPYTYAVKSSNKIAKLSIGYLLELVDKVLLNESLNGFAVIRPPGHHSGSSTPAGFCLYNNVAIAARYAQKKFGLKKILIIDWDIHHGNGIQDLFEDDQNIFYISLHDVFDYPKNPKAFHECKSNIVNIPWRNKSLNDFDYLMAFFRVILPIAYELNPELILVSCGFDAAQNDLLGKFKLSPQVYGHFVHLLSPLAKGKLILALEGGYNLRSISLSASYCVSALLNDSPSRLSLDNIDEETFQTIDNVINFQSQRWMSL